ncbi:hypothetical protein SAY87_012638 [Trapa incisa]|uniref:Uncharacterized protein n=1 Tax=Trapa incisa TaxID=236973 RepID=A0AAN7GL80_9MYRT|nr:hypothetical protein SAY87_012638 [Trapa incisa]
MSVKRRHGNLRVLSHQRRRRRRRRRMSILRSGAGKKTGAMEMQNLRLFMKNQRIIQENELLREKRLFSSTTTSLAQEQIHRMIKLLRNVEIVIYQ